MCRKCHHQCRNCTAFGIHSSVCRCLHYVSGELCEDHCPRDHYPDEDNHLCIKCAEECRGCRGPTVSDCIACRNFRIYDNVNESMVRGIFLVKTKFASRVCPFIVHCYINYFASYRFISIIFNVTDMHYVELLFFYRGQVKNI